MVKQLQHVLKPLGASLLYGLSSTLIVIVNKTVLTSYKFPSFQVLGIGQIVAIILVIGVAKTLGMVHFPNPSISQCRKVWPLPCFYILNLVFGLGSTKKLNLPMFTVLRRFTLLFITVGQIYVLDQYESVKVNVTILLMVGGAIIAAMNDLAFDLTGYIFILINDFTTAANSIYSKKKLNTEMSKSEILFYNSLVSLVPALAVAAFTGDLNKAYQYEGWGNHFFQLGFLASCIMGFVLMYATVLVNQLTSPLTVAVVGCIKNVIVTYCGIFIGGDYVFEIFNFIGINISVFASIVYSLFKLRESNPVPRPDSSKNQVSASSNV